MSRRDSNIGRIFGDRYEIINRVGVGGSAVVYGVYDSLLDQTVAMKMLDEDAEDSQEAIDRFKQEAELLATFDHEGIVKLYDKHFEGSPKYFIMEYVEGITLKKHILNKGALSQAEIFSFIKPVLSALDEVHKKGFVHSDIKPQNVVVLGDGKIKLMDFGISKPMQKKIMDIDDKEDGENTEVAVGTVHYVSPEQAEARPLDSRSDIYSLGVMMYEMATGILPFLGIQKASQIAYMHVHELPPAPSFANPKVSPELEYMILKAMEKDPANRYSSAEEMLLAIEELEHPKKEEEETAKTFQDKVRDFFTDFSIPSAVIGGLCAMLVAVVMSLGILSSAIINERARTDFVRVPDLVGTELFSSGLSLLDHELYSFKVKFVTSNKNKGLVVSQSPKAGTAVNIENGSCEITLTVAYRDPPALMPNLLALTKEEATVFMESCGIKAEIITCPHNFMGKDRVFETIPAVGEAITEKKVTVFVSESENN